MFHIIVFQYILKLIKLFFSFLIYLKKIILKMKEYTITLKISIEAQNNIDLENINDFADELTENITEQSTSSIVISDVTIDEVTDLNDDMLDNDEETIEVY